MLAEEIKIKTEKPELEKKQEGIDDPESLNLEQENNAQEKSLRENLDNLGKKFADSFVSARKEVLRMKSVLGVEMSPLDIDSVKKLEDEYKKFLGAWLEKKEDSEKDFLKAKELISLAEKMYFSERGSEQGEINDFLSEIEKYIGSFGSVKTEDKTEKIIDFQKILSSVQEISGENRDTWREIKNLKMSEIVDEEVRGRIVAMSEKIQKPAPAENEKIITWIVGLDSAGEDKVNASEENEKTVNLDEKFLDLNLSPDQKKELEIFFQETFRRTFMTEVLASLGGEEKLVLKKKIKEREGFKKIDEFLKSKLDDYAKIKEEAKRLLNQVMENIFQNLY